ncbi:diguanylate cyclase [Shewanella baltica]|uniref:diguanylate cyclase n=1 Tax=Shewanella baltica TaxID=62322 RepID=UPI003D7B0AB8
MCHNHRQLTQANFQRDFSLHLPAFQTAHLRLAIILGVFGLVLNLFPIPLFANVQLILGNVAVVIVAILLGPWYALITALFTATGLMIVWSSPHVYLLFLLEALWLGFARRRDIQILYASVSYWVLLGIPLLAIYVAVIAQMPASHIPFTAIKQAVNGMIYAAIGELCVVAIPSLWHFKGKLTNLNRRTFSSQLSYLFTLIITVSLLVSSLAFNHFFIDKQQVLINRNLDDTATHLSHATDNYLAYNTQVIASTAKFLSLSNADINEWQALLSSVHDSNQNFKTMLLANEQGNLLAVSPMTNVVKLDSLSDISSVSDREYFIQAFYNHKTFVSPAFIGRGFGNDVIVAISAPIFSQNDPNQARGIVEGSLDLRYFSSIDKQNLHHEQQSILLTDENNNLIYASEGLGLAPLTPLSFSKGSEIYRARLQLMNLHNLDSNTPEYIYAQHKLNNGWQLYVLEPFVPLLKLAERQYVNTVILLFCSLVGAFFITKAISKLLTEPLSLLAQHFGPAKQEKASDEKFEHDLLDKSTPKEIYSLYESLASNQQALLEHQQELEQKVQQRTQDLEAANVKLKDLAERDPLTNLYNRRYTEHQFPLIQQMCERGQDAMTLAILDLDHFKQINDTYGHLGGDECLKVVAELLTSLFKRDIDLISRYGGEEFLLILPMCNALKVEAHLNEFKRQLAGTVIINPQDHRSFKVTASIGAVIANATYSDSLEYWLKQADNNLYLAKEQGRDRVVCSLIV